MFVLKRVSGNLYIRFQNKVIIIQSSMMYISWKEIAFGLISLKRKTNDQRLDTLLKMRVSCTTGQNFTILRIFLCTNISLTVCQIDEKNIREIQLRKVSQQNMPLGSGLSDCHQSDSITWCELKISAKIVVDISKSKVSIAAEARNLNSTLVASQWFKPN